MYLNLIVLLLSLHVSIYSHITYKSDPTLPRVSRRVEKRSEALIFQLHLDTVPQDGLQAVRDVPRRAKNPLLAHDKGLMRPSKGHQATLALQFPF